MTPLLLAAATAHGQACQVLIQTQVDVSAPSDAGTTAVDLAWNIVPLREILENAGAVRGTGVTGQGRRRPRAEPGTVPMASEQRRQRGAQWREWRHAAATGDEQGKGKGKGQVTKGKGQRKGKGKGKPQRDG